MASRAALNRSVNSEPGSREIGFRYNDVMRSDTAVADILMQSASEVLMLGG
jgi:hypothetical protein